MRRVAPGSEYNHSPAFLAPGSPDAFDTVLRGYNRLQVDSRIADLTEQIDALEADKQAMAAQLASMQRRADSAEQELAGALARLADSREKVVDPESAQSFGYRAERILRMAETEANDVRTAAIQEAAALLAKARADAEAHRHEIEQNLIMRATTLDKQATEVAQAMRQREEEVAAELVAARQAAQELRASARRDMDRAREDLEAVAQDVRLQAEKWAEEHRAAAARDVEHLVGLRDTVRTDLVKLAEALRDGVADDDPVEAGEPESGRDDDAAAVRPAGDDPDSPTDQNGHQEPTARQRVRSGPAHAQRSDS